MAQGEAAMKEEMEEMWPAAARHMQVKAQKRTKELHNEGRSDEQQQKQPPLQLRRRCMLMVLLKVQMKGKFRLRCLLLVHLMLQMLGTVVSTV